MSNFSKRAKFLSILAAASAVGNAGAGAGATTIQDYKYIPASSAAQSASRINLKPANGSSSNIKPFVTGFGSAAALSAAAVLVKNLFFNEERSNINLFIQALKKSKVVCLQFSVSHVTNCYAVCSGGEVVNDFRTLSDDDRLVSELAGIDEKMDKDKADDLCNRTRHKYALGMLGVAASFPVGRDQEVMVYAKKVGNDDYKIQIDSEFGQGLTEEKFKETVDKALDVNKKNAEAVKRIKKDAKVVYDILNSKLVKEVLGHAIKAKWSYDPNLMFRPIVSNRNVPLRGIRRVKFGGMTRGGESLIENINGEIEANFLQNSFKQDENGEENQESNRIELHQIESNE